MIDGDI
jgi:hypothetical protein